LGKYLIKPSIKTAQMLHPFFLSPCKVQLGVGLINMQQLLPSSQDFMDKTYLRGGGLWCWEKKQSAA
jgi:hypothetical protein